MMRLRARPRMRWLRILCGALSITTLASTAVAAQGANVAVQIRDAPKAGLYGLKDRNGCTVEPANGEHPRTLKVIASDPSKAARPKDLGKAIFTSPLTGSNRPSHLFDIHLVIGPPDNPAADYHVSSLSDSSKVGTGIVEVDLQAPGDSSFVKFVGRTADGVNFFGWIKCKKPSG